VQSVSKQFLKDRGCVLSFYQTKYRIRQKSGRQSAWSVFLGSIAQLCKHAGSASLMAGFDIVNAGQACATLVGCRLEANRQGWNKLVKWVAIGRLASPWLTVGKVDGGVPSNKVALADRASIGEVLLADW
jgi:hypothetical protein